MIFREHSHGNNAKTFSESSKHWITFFENKSIFQLVAQPLSAINCFSYVEQCTVVHNCCAFTLHISLLRGIVFFSILIFCLSHSHKKSKFEAAHKRSTLRHCDKVHGCQCMHRTAINYLPLQPHWYHFISSLLGCYFFSTRLLFEYFTFVAILALCWIKSQ